MTFFLILLQNSDQFNSIEFSYDIDQKKKIFISGDHAERKKNSAIQQQNMTFSKTQWFKNKMKRVV